MSKIRRTFNQLGSFLEYERGNVMCNLLTWMDDGTIGLWRPPISIPIYFTKFLADNWESIPREYKKLIIY
jgi:hypothetical protein